MRVLILAAGYGTRLYPLTVNLPKALLPVKKRHILDFIIDKINQIKPRASVKEIVLVTNNRFYDLFMQWRKNISYDITIVNDGTNFPGQRLGAIKDINFSLQGRPLDDWLIIGSDNFFDWQLTDFIKFARSKRPSPTVGVYALDDKKSAVRFGVVTFGLRGRIKQFIEKPKFPPANTIAVCIYYFPKESLTYIDSFLKQDTNHDVTGRYIHWLTLHIPVYGFEFKGRWIDVGHADSLKQVKAWA